jgi:hypothetical protein
MDISCLRVDLGKIFTHGYLRLETRLDYLSAPCIAAARTMQMFEENSGRVENRRIIL